jgi:hypothetical protein
MNNWRFRRRTFPLTRREAHSRVEAIPIANIDILLRTIIDVMNEIRPTDDFDAILATRLYYAVMCLKRFFPGWGITMQPHHLRNASPSNRNGNPPDMNRDSSDIDNYSETEPLITEV